MDTKLETCSAKMGTKKIVSMWKFTEDKNWEVLENQFSWVKDMENVEQHKFHHAEGSVNIHTKMVLDSLLCDPNYMQLSLQDKEILWVAALMHDIEKRSTSINEGNGIIRSPNHAKKGEKTVRELLYKDLDTPFAIREKIASLVRLHGLPLWMSEKIDPQKEIIKASWRCPLSELHLLSLADVKGRICTDQKELLNRLDYFELYAKEENCWKNPRKFITCNSAYQYFNNDNTYVDYIPFDVFKSKVTVLSGLPGMGKDYYLHKLDADIPIISLDNLRRKYKISPTDKSGNGHIVHEAKDIAKTYLRQGQNFIWNATNITYAMRKQLIDLFVNYGAFVNLVYIERPFKIWQSQNKNREYSIPINVLDKMFVNLEPPLLWEAHQVDYITE